MVKIKLTVILIACFAFFILGAVSAEEIRIPIAGGVYHMISSPYMPEDRDPQMSLADDFGPYDPTQWRFYRYAFEPDPDEPDQGQSRYFELKTPDWIDEHDFDFGRGYWVISRSTRTIDIEGEPIPAEMNQIILEHRGSRWNQIGNICDYDFPIASLYVARKSNPLDTKQLIDAGDNNLTYVTLQEFENGSYLDIPINGSLQVGKGYWLRVLEDVGEPVLLIFELAALQSVSATNFATQDFLIRAALQEAPPAPPPGFTSSFNSDSDGATVGCFIATAAYRGYDHPDVQVLRKFRDRYLLTSSFGRIFVEIYYRFSPALARFVANYEPIKALVRLSLMPVMGFGSIVSKTEAHNFLIFFVVPLLGGFFLLKKGVWGRCKTKFSRKSEEGKRRI